MFYRILYALRQLSSVCLRAPQVKRNICRFPFFFVVNFSPLLRLFQHKRISCCWITATVTRHKLVPPHGLCLGHTGISTVTALLHTGIAPRSLLRQYTGIACELTVTAEAHWNQTPYQHHHLLSDHIDHAFIALRQAQRDQLR